MLLLNTELITSATFVRTTAWSAARPRTSVRAVVALFQGAQGGVEASFWTGYFTNFFVLVIWALFVLSLYFSWQYLKRLRGQRAALDRAEAGAAAVREGRESDAEFVERKLLEGVPADSIVAERVRELKALGQGGGPVEQSALADTLAVREGARTSFAKYVASVLVLLGLCGAIYGLSNLVRQMGPELRKMQELSRQAQAAQTSPAEAGGRSFEAIQESVGTLIEAMAGSLEHTRGAFAASLTGIALSILLLFVNWYVGREQASLLARVEEFTSAHLLPLFAPSSPAFELSGAVNAFSLGAEHAADLAENLHGLTEKARESFSNLFVFVEKFAQGADSVERSQQSAAEAQAKLLTLVGRFTELTERIEEHQAGSKGDISTAVATVNSTNVDIKAALDDWGRRHENVLRQLERIASQWTAESKEVKKETRDLLSQDVSQFRAQVMESFEKQQKFNQDQLTRMLEEQKSYVEGLQTALLNGQGHKELVEGVGKVFRSERDSFSAQFKKFVEPQQSLLEQLEKVVERQGALVDRLEALSRAVVAPPEAAARAGGPPQQSIQALAQEQRETNRGVKQLSNYAKRLIEVTVIFISGAVAIALTAGGVAVALMFELWPDPTAGRVGLLVGLLGLGAACAYAVSRRLLQDNED